jgi:hypothetical protein
VQPAGLRGLHVRGSTLVAVEEHRAGGRIPVRSRHGDGQQVAAEAGVQRVHEARAAVGHRYRVQLVTRRLPVPALDDHVGRLGSAQRAGELVRSHQDAHAAQSVAPGHDPLPHPYGRAARFRRAPCESDASQA